MVWRWILLETAESRVLVVTVEKSLINYLPARTGIFALRRFGMEEDVGY